MDPRWPRALAHTKAMSEMMDSFCNALPYSDHGFSVLFFAAIACRSRL
jgi:hypothetical protein